MNQKYMQEVASSKRIAISSVCLKNTKTKLSPGFVKTKISWLSYWTINPKHQKEQSYLVLFSPI